MRLPRFLAVDLEYGCHAGRFELPDEARPVVIAGPNGSGKTTLLEALLRTLYGFSRRRPEERSRLELRRPWTGRPGGAEVEIATVEGSSIGIHRDFATDEVVVRESATGNEIFRGDANPAGVRSASRHYQELVGQWIGFDALEPYRRTAWIGQGELIETRLDDELLRAAAGSHRKVEAALGELREEYEALTVEPIEPGGRRKNRPRELEELHDRLAELSTRLDDARTARARRRPLLERAKELRAGVEILDAEIELLEDAYRPLTERRSLEAEERETRRRLAALTQAVGELEAARRAAEQATSERRRAEADGSYPDDLESRLGQATILWDRLEALEAGDRAGGAAGPERSASGTGRGLALAGAALAGAALLVGGVVWSVLGSLLPGLAAAVLGVAFLASARRIDSGRPRGGRGGQVRPGAADERDEVERRLAGLASGLPAPPLARSSADAHRQRFRRLREAKDTQRQAERALTEAATRGRRLLAESGTPAPEEALEGRDADRLAGRLADTAEDARTALARTQLRISEQPVVPPLPEGVEPTVAAVEQARAERRAERSALADEDSRVELDLRDAERVAEDVFRLERRIAALGERAAEVEDEVRVRRAAWELVRDAHQQFRQRDQERLLAAVNRHLERISGGRLGPLESEGDLSRARVALAGRFVTLDSPPLSFGEKHVLLLAIRLGAADFVAVDGLRHPLLVDEPFTHLDELRARDVWGLLCSLALDRQVIVTTQNRLVLDHLGVAPDIDLPLPAPSVPGSALPAEARDEGRQPPERAPEPQCTSAAEPVPARPEQAQLELG